MRGIKGILTSLSLACFLLVTMHTVTAAQGRGRGGGGGGGGGGGRPAGVGGPSSGPSNRSAGHADVGRNHASEKSNNAPDRGIERAKLQRENARRADDELRNNPHMPSRLHTTANDLRIGYQAALANNPGLTFGQYVAATRLADNLGRRHLGVTRSAILSGLANGDSIGQTLQNLGVGKRESTDAIKHVDREIKEAKRRN
jgi:hypothetical protein